jgi:hypothetical protein
LVIVAADVGLSALEALPQIAYTLSSIDVHSAEVGRCVQ